MLYGEASSPWRHQDKVRAIVCFFVVVVVFPPLLLSSVVLCMIGSGMRVPLTKINEQPQVLTSQGRLCQHLVWIHSCFNTLSANTVVLYRSSPLKTFSLVWAWVWFFLMIHAFSALCKVQNTLSQGPSVVSTTHHMHREWEEIYIVSTVETSPPSGWFSKKKDPTGKADEE